MREREAEPITERAVKPASDRKKVHRGLPGSGRSALMPDPVSHRAYGSPSASRARLRRRSLHLGASRGRPQAGAEAMAGTRVPITPLVPAPACLRACGRCGGALWLDPREPQGPGESSLPTFEASSAQVERP